MTSPQPIGLPLIGRMSSSQVFLGGLLSSRARLRFPGHAQAQPSTPRSPSKSQRTAYRAFQHCLTQGVHPRGSPVVVKPYSFGDSPNPLISFDLFFEIVCI